MTRLQELMNEKILVLDGAMGTALQKMNLTAQDFGGPALEGCNEHLVLSKPEAITAVHESYLAAGADIIETNSFGSTPLVLAEYGLADRAGEISRESARLARAAADRFASSKKPRFVAGSVGPTTKSLFVTGGTTFPDLVDHFRVQGIGLLEGGVDLFLVETCQDSLNIKAALIGLDRAMAEAGRPVPVSVSATIELMGTTLGGQGVEALYYSLQQRNLLTFGLNCATGPDFMTDHIRQLSEICRGGVSCYPNAGLPDENGRYNETPQGIAQKLERFVDRGWVNLLGGCCGTTDEHIRLMAQMVDGKTPRRASPAPRFSLSGLDPLVVTDEVRPVVVGERTNVIGSRKFKDMIVAGRFEEASEIGRRQARAGAPVIDVCLANPDRSELSDMETFLGFLTKKVKTPLMIDSTDPAVMEAALQLCPGRGVINSVNLEEGEARMGRVARLAKEYGAALVVGCIDEDKTQGMAVTRERKLEVARRSFGLLTGKFGLEPEDLVFDPLVFPAATGDANYIGSARETIEGVRAVKEALPRCKTILGISNVSFGLPEAGREVMNAVFLHDNVKAGLDFAIVNSEKLARYANLPEEEIRLARDVLFADASGSRAAVDRFTAYFRGKSAAPRAPAPRLGTPEERLVRNVVEGSKEGLVDDLNTLLDQSGRSPLEIVNGPLMKGMDEVGRLFAKNEMIVAEVLQSAEVMKAAVAHLEPRMSQSDLASRGTLLLATVKGDVHDIGKNLVHIILKNNGYRVVDLGIKCPPEELIRAVKEHRPDMVGLSGLLVKSAQQMVVTTEDLKNAGVSVPVLVGGAALSEKFTSSQIAPSYGGDVFYAKDAMAGLELANRLMDPATQETLRGDNRRRQSALRTPTAPVPSLSVAAVQAIHHSTPPPAPPDYKRHVVEDISVEDVFRYLNPVMLYGKHLGLRGQLKKLLEARDEKAVKLNREVTSLQEEILARGWLKPRAVWRFFPAESAGNHLVLFEDAERSRSRTIFEFPRQSGGERRCLSDFVAPSSSGHRDHVALFAVTCGDGVMSLSRQWREQGDYLKSHALQSIAIESAEALAELLHDRLRTMWGIPDDPSLTLSDKFQARYRGLRVSFGYPACPALEDQRKLFDLLRPEEIGITLTENDMMEPEASVSAVVFHHPQAHYFSVADV